MVGLRLCLMWLCPGWRGRYVARCQSPHQEALEALSLARIGFGWPRGCAGSTGSFVLEAVPGAAEHDSCRAGHERGQT